MKVTAPSSEQSYFNIRYHSLGEKSHCAILVMKTSHIYLPVKDATGKMSLEKESNQQKSQRHHRNKVIPTLDISH